MITQEALVGQRVRTHWPGLGPRQHAAVAVIYIHADSVTVKPRREWFLPM